METISERYEKLCAQRALNSPDSYNWDMLKIGLSKQLWTIDPTAPGYLKRSIFFGKMDRHCPSGKAIGLYSKKTKTLEEEDWDNLWLIMMNDYAEKLGLNIELSGSLLFVTEYVCKKM